MRKIFLIVLLIIGALAQNNSFKLSVKDQIYDKIQEILSNQYPDEEKKVKCMVEYFRNNDIADKFNNLELLFNQVVKLARAIEPYIIEAESSCKNFPIIKLIAATLIFLVMTWTCLISLKRKVNRNDFIKKL